MSGFESKLQPMARQTNQFYCFSPPAMLAIFVTELILAIYTLVRYKLTPISRLVLAMVSLLAIFQLAEYHVCGQDSPSSMAWTRIGYVAITLLPALAIHLIQLIAGRRDRMIVGLAYGMSLAFAVIFGFGAAAFSSHVCTGNYAIFNLAPKLGGYYFAYYYGWLIVGIGLCLNYSLSASRQVRRALVLQVYGYLSFLLPTGIVNTLRPETIAGIPSVMCGFAVIYAFILVFGILRGQSSAIQKD
jgi:N-terminal 7TM region of histidine kinase